MRKFINICESGSRLSLAHKLIDEISSGIHIPENLVNWMEFSENILSEYGVTSWNQIVKWLENDSNKNKFSAHFKKAITPMVIAHLSKFNGIIYRSLSVDNNFINKLQGTNITLGIHWTSDKTIADGWLGLNPPEDLKEHDAIICAEVDFDDVDWHQTLICAIELYDFEREISLNKGAQLTLKWATIDGEIVPTYTRAIA